MKLTIIHEHYFNQDEEVPSWARSLHRKLDFINERLNHMATDAQVAKLSADIGTLLSAITAYQASVTAAIAKAQAQSPDPAIDALDASVQAASASLTSATAPVTPPAPAAPGAGT